MLVHTKQLASTDEEKILAGNLNDVKSVPVLQKISSEKNLDNRLDSDAFMECFKIQEKQDVEKTSSKLKHSAINLTNADDEEPSLSEDQHKSIRKSSSFIAPIEAVVKDTNDKARKEDEAEGAPQKNTHFCESVLDILLDYASTVPLWSGVMLKHLGKTRDSNAIVKNWFRTTKNVVLASKLHKKSRRFSAAPA